MFQKIGAWEEETAGRSGGLSLRPLMLVAQGPPFTTTTSTELGEGGCGCCQTSLPRPAWPTEALA